MVLQAPTPREAGNPVLTDFARDHAFTITWFGLMAFVWFGWGQEDPPARWRGWLGAGSLLGLVFAGSFGVSVARLWKDGTALDGAYWSFGVVVLLEVLAAGVGCLLLWKRRQARWMAWWVALIVALHLIPLAFYFDDWAHAVLGVIQAAGLLLLVPRFRRNSKPTSRLVGPLMGTSFLVFSAVSASLFVVQRGLPW